jgi:glycosyltransferase involved in cell wall biosynthesis
MNDPMIKPEVKSNQKLKVLVCAYACISDPDKRFGNGGEGVLGWNIVKQLARFHQVFVLTHSQNRSDIEKALEKEPISNVKFYYLDLPNFFSFLQRFSGGIQIYTYFWQIKAYFFAKKLHQKIHFDVFHHLTYANDWMASFIGALLPIPYLRGPGGGAHKVPKNFLSEFSLFDHLAQYLRSLGQWFFRHDPFFILSQKRAKAILVCNHESFKAIPKKWQKKVYLFPVNGISREDLDLLSKTEKKDNNRLKVLSAGKLLPIKGFSLAIKAFKIFSDKFPETEFEIIGDGPELGHLKNLVSKLAIEDKVKFKNWLPRNEFLKELTSCDVFLFPSLRDGGGQVVVEAMAAQKPVICLDIAGPGFHIKEEWGIKIKPESPEKAIKEMAGALEKLYFDKELRIQLGKAARERAEKEYLWDNLGEKLFKIYQKVLKV